MNWTGPRDSDCTAESSPTLLHVVPPERWPYGPPDHHEDCCLLFSDGLYCDCKASDASDAHWGYTP